jgi:hypothetical protein
MKWHELTKQLSLPWSVVTPFNLTVVTTAPFLGRFFRQRPTCGRLPASGRLLQRETVRVMAIFKLGWVKQQQQKLAVRGRETSRDYIADHAVLGFPRNSWSRMEQRRWEQKPP